MVRKNQVVMIDYEVFALSRIKLRKKRRESLARFDGGGGGGGGVCLRFLAGDASGIEPGLLYQLQHYRYSTEVGIKSPERQDFGANISDNTPPKRLPGQYLYSEPE